ncbi:MAG: hypothetical protein GWN07_05005, partial [Actinobacteria bacterium]|nr:hypothetical protein [Actinomycetota bacterium]NIU64863.1 hypothetical protein [Actinomycetota bacterium]NIV86009.1 hypothetical protein [Actinomycetota bacterium]NIW26670.1 hypothetical protein [Actinomycetota bacterium]NIX19225.1 hypothetical protein [Actinomycetota bacterium]
LIVGVAIVGVTVTVALLGVLTPFTLLITIPVVIGSVIWLWPVGTLAVTALVLAPRGTPPARTAYRLVAGRWPPVAGRVLILAVVGFGIGIGINMVTTPVSLASVWVGVLVAVVLQVFQYAFGTAGAIELYDWAEGPVDPDLTA